MIERLTPGQRRLAALLLLAAALLAGGAGLIWPVWALNRHYQETIDDMQSRLERYRKAAAIRTRLQAQHEELTRGLAEDAHYLRSDSDSLAAAELQNIVKRGIEPGGGTVMSTQILPTSNEEGFSRVSIKVRMRGQLENIVSAFHAFETGSPYLFLDNVFIRGKPASRVRQRRAGQNSQLDVDFELSGYIRTRRP